MASRPLASPLGGGSRADAGALGFDPWPFASALFFKARALAAATTLAHDARVVCFVVGLLLFSLQLIERVKVLLRKPHSVSACRPPDVARHAALQELAAIVYLGEGPFAFMAIASGDFIGLVAYTTLADDARVVCSACGPQSARRIRGNEP
jgi:hypothetical protein